MELVKNIQDINSNVAVLEGYLQRKADPHYSFAVDLIKRGTCFCVVSTSSGLKFYPSRFVGYLQNSMESHLNNDDKDGRETNPAISRILHVGKPMPDAELNKAYCAFCEDLGFVARERGSFGVERKFWVLNQYSVPALLS